MSKLKRHIDIYIYIYICVYFKYCHEKYIGIFFINKMSYNNFSSLKFTKISDTF